MFYISEENLGDSATREQAERLIKILQDQGYEVEYGSSLDSDIEAGEQMDFDAAFYAALEQIAAESE